MFSSLALVLLQLWLGSRKRKGREQRDRDSTKGALGGGYGVWATRLALGSSGHLEGYVLF
jgi:hypothetical protein